MENFVCQHCEYQVINTGNMGVKNRNHCPRCLWSKHVDEQTAGDRAASCQGLMMPIGLSFKKSPPNKYGKVNHGELMLVHRCKKCDKISINRIAGDDDGKEIVKVFNTSLTMNPAQKATLQKMLITILEEKDQAEIEQQIFGNY
ncbi:RNHCP domain-containing protein [Candidatus Microgenomates bacterium]|nr:MAG: RNHCP domain-containing protein [Candidatus Microgenomates bacterium]